LPPRSISPHSGPSAGDDQPATLAPRVGGAGNVPRTAVCPCRVSLARRAEHPVPPCRVGVCAGFASPFRDRRVAGYRELQWRVAVTSLAAPADAATLRGSFRRRVRSPTRSWYSAGRHRTRPPLTSDAPARPDGLGGMGSCETRPFYVGHVGEDAVPCQAEGGTHPPFPFLKGAAEAASESAADFVSTCLSVRNGCILVASPPVLHAHATLAPICHPHLAKLVAIGEC